MVDSVDVKNTTSVSNIRKIQFNKEFCRYFKFCNNYFNNLKEISCDEIIKNSNDYIESNQMEGFRYICDNSYYSVKYKNMKVVNFPLVCPGMIEIWRKSNENFAFV